MNTSDIIGLFGIFIGILVPIPQIIKIYKTKVIIGISKTTYRLIMVTVICYLYRAIYIKDWVFIVANSIALILTFWILCLLEKYCMKGWRVTLLKKHDLCEEKKFDYGKLRRDIKYNYELYGECYIKGEWNNTKSEGCKIEVLSPEECIVENR